MFLVMETEQYFKGLLIMFKNITILFVLLFVATAHARIYTWTDENGKKHFGDAVPPQYQAKSESVHVNTNAPSAEQIEAARKRASDIDSANRSRDRESQTQQSKIRRTVSTKTQTNQSVKKPKQNGASSHYQSRKVCYEMCRKPLYGPPDAYGREVIRGYNNSGCGHCENIPEP